MAGFFAASAADAGLSHSDVDSNGKNKKALQCFCCGSIVLRSGDGMLVSHPEALPKMTQKAAGVVETQHFDHFWLVHDVFTFENVGFSKDVGDKKYLLCADCEMGPLGFQNKESGESYVAIKRVKYVAT